MNRPVAFDEIKAIRSYNINNYLIIWAALMET